MTEVNKKPLTYLCLHQFNLEANSNNENAICQMHLTDSLNGCDCHNRVTHIFKYALQRSLLVGLLLVLKGLRKTLSHRKTLKDFASYERPRVTENLLKNWRT